MNWLYWLHWFRLVKKIKDKDKLKDSWKSFIGWVKTVHWLYWLHWFKFVELEKDRKQLKEKRQKQNTKTGTEDPH